MALRFPSLEEEEEEQQQLGERSRRRQALDALSLASTSLLDPFLRAGSYYGEGSALVEARRAQMMRDDIIAREMLRLRRYRNLLEEELRRVVETERALTRLQSTAHPVLVGPSPSPSRADVFTFGVAGEPQRTVAGASAGGNACIPLKDNKTGTKRKADAAADTPTLLPQASQKEWTCSICNLTVNDQKTFNGHLNGKKHKSKLALMNMQKNASKIIHGSNSNENNAKKKRLACATNQTIIVGNIALPEYLKDHQNKVKEMTVCVNKALCESHDGFTFSSIIEANKSVLIEENSGKNKHIWCKLCEVRNTCGNGLVIHLNGKKHKARLAKWNSQVHGETSGNASLGVKEGNKEDAEGTAKMNGDRACEIIEERSGKNTTNEKEMASKLVIGSIAHISKDADNGAENIGNLMNVATSGSDVKADEVMQKGQEEFTTNKWEIADKPLSNGLASNIRRGMCKGDEYPGSLASENDSAVVKFCNKEGMFVAEEKGKRIIGKDMAKELILTGSTIQTVNGRGAENAGNIINMKKVGVKSCEEANEVVEGGNRQSATSDKEMADELVTAVGPTDLVKKGMGGAEDMGSLMHEDRLEERSCGAKAYEVMEEENGEHKVNDRNMVNEKVLHDPIDQHIMGKVDEDAGYGHMESFINEYKPSDKGDVIMEAEKGNNAINDEETRGMLTKLDHNLEGLDEGTGNLGSLLTRERVVGAEFGMKADEVMEADNGERIAYATDITDKGEPLKDNKMGTKRKADDAAETSSLPPQASQKGWTCSICGVTSTSQKCFDFHLSGKKHKSRLASMNAQQNASKIVYGSVAIEKNAKKRRTCTTNQKSKASVNEALCESHDRFPFSEIMEANKSVLVEVCDGAKVLPKNQASRKKHIWCKLCEVSVTNGKGLTIHLEGKKHRTRFAKRNSQAHGETSITATLGVMEANKVDMEGTININVDKVSEIMEKRNEENVRNEKEIANGVVTFGSNIHILKGSDEGAENIGSLMNIARVGAGFGEKADEIMKEGQGKSIANERDIADNPSSIGSTHDNGRGICEGDENLGSLTIEKESGGVNVSNKEGMLVAENSGNIVDEEKVEVKSGEEADEVMEGRNRKSATSDKEIADNLVMEEENGESTPNSTNTTDKVVSVGPTNQNSSGLLDGSGILESLLPDGVQFGKKEDEVLEVMNEMRIPDGSGVADVISSVQAGADNLGSLMNGELGRVEEFGSGSMNVDISVKNKDSEVGS